LLLAVERIFVGERMRTLVLAFCLAALTAASAAADPAPAERFVDPVSSWSAKLSPSGNYVAYAIRTPSSDRPDGQQVVVVDLANNTWRPIELFEPGGGYISWISWKGDDRLIVDTYVNVRRERRRSDPRAISVQRIFAMDRDGGHLTEMFHGNLYKLGEGDTSILNTLPTDPTHILIQGADETGASIWRADVGTGEAELVQRGDGFTEGFALDGSGYPVIRIDSQHVEDGYRIYRRAHGAQDWTFVLDARRAEAAAQASGFDVIGAGPGDSQVYVIARPNGRDTSALYLFNTATGDYGAPIAETSGADAADPWINSITHEVMATCELVQRLACTARDPAIAHHLQAIDAFFQHQAEVTLVTTSADGDKWLLYVDGPLDPGEYYIYQRSQAHIDPLVLVYPHMDRAALSPIEIVPYRARDGAQLWAYVTAQAGQSGPRPMVVWPHGGPEARDFYGFDGYAQFLASRGYVVLQPNFRGGEGFGRAFAEAGYGQWGKLMQNDVTDAVQHMIDAGVADPHRICVVGASYGGYVALAGAATTPNLYRCAVSISGVSDPGELVHAALAVGNTSTLHSYWVRSVGDDAISPQRLAANIHIPILLIHGDSDHTVSIHQSEHMADALRAAGNPTRLIRLPNEDHIWDEWSAEDRLTVYRETEAFLAQNLGPTTQSVNSTH